MSTTSESSPLLSKPPQKKECQKYSSCSVKYRLPMITEKGAIVMIVCSVLTVIAVSAQLLRIFLTTITSVPFLVIAIITFPIVGIVADAFIGRFKVIQASSVLLMVSSLLSILVTLLQNYLPTTAKTIGALCTAGIFCIGASCYFACAFPFVADQLIGASGEQLSFSVYWLMWGFVIGSQTMLLQSIPSDYFDIVLEAVSFLCIFIMVFIFSYFKHLLTIFPHLFNPYKLIFKVLNYTWKHKYPERRSALTYWEEDIPSRIDLGMCKYGGPFTVEEVEDVKTFLRLLPVLLCGGGCNAGLFNNWYQSLDVKGFLEDSKPAIFYVHLSQLIIFASGIPIYHFLLYPLFYNYIPTMLNRIRFGLILLICSNCLSGFVGELWVCNSLTNTTCLLFHSERFNISSHGVWWVTVPMTVYNVGFLLSTITLLEFVWAQSPRQLCGVSTGFAVMSVALSAFICYGFRKLVATIISNNHIWFYGDLSIAFIISVYFILFYCISKRYKLRKRDDIVPIHLFAEEFFEKELRGRESLDKTRFVWDEDSNVVQ